MPTTHVVWFKRDLRLHDHAVLNAAAAGGPVLALYVIEPELWSQPSASTRHWQVIQAALLDREHAMAQHGGSLCVRIGTMEEVLVELQQALGHFALLAHEEIGEDWSFKRDKAVAAWCAGAAISFTELPQFGVFRGQHDRDGWATRWRQFMTQPQQQTPQTIRWTHHPSTANWQDWQPKPSRPGIANFNLPSAPAVLEGFLQRRGEQYHLKMSSPLSAPEACSRLSVQLASGRLSMRTVVQETWRAQRQVKTWPAEQRGTWPKALAAFQSRLHWHCHFMQKFESEPELEHCNMARSCDGLRENDFDEAKFQAWCTGHTGYPFIDACMRFLLAKGWINFRMRAMLVSFAAYDLWLHWQRPAHHLAQLFIDFEPGIHYPQVQMQSGTTGINTLRIYNPIKQSMDQDPKGEFIRRWVPECAGFDQLRIHAPWEATAMEQLAAGCQIGEHYPEPIVDHMSAARFAKAQFAGVRRSAAGQADKQTVMQRHGSRKTSSRKTGSRKTDAQKKPAASIEKRAPDNGAATQ